MGEKNTETLEVLLVEPDRLVRVLLASGLNDAHIGVCEVESGETALAILEHRRFDIVLTDVGMPGISGIELANQIRALEQAANTPTRMRLIALTGMINAPGDAERMTEHFDLVLEKPMTVERLLTILRD